MNLKKIVRKRLGELLIAEGLLGSEHVQAALEEQNRTGELLGEILVRFEYVDEYNIAKALCNHFQLPYIIPSMYDVPKEALDIMPASFLHEHQILPMDQFGDMIVFAMSGIISKQAVEEIQNTLNCDISVYIGTITGIKNRLRELIPYGFDIDRKAKRSLKQIQDKATGDTRDGRKTSEGGKRKLTMGKDYLMVKISKSVKTSDDVGGGENATGTAVQEELDPSFKRVNIEVTGGDASDDGLFEGEVGDDWMSMFDEADQEIESSISPAEQAAAEAAAAAAAAGNPSAPPAQDQSGNRDWSSMFDEADGAVQSEAQAQPAPNQPAAPAGPQGEGDWASMLDDADTAVKRDAGLAPPSANEDPSQPAASSESQGEGDWASMLDDADTAVKRDAGIEEEPISSAPPPPPPPSKRGNQSEGEGDWASMLDDADSAVKRDAGVEESGITPPPPPPPPRRKKADE